MAVVGVVLAAQEEYGSPNGRHLQEQNHSLALEGEGVAGAERKGDGEKFPGPAAMMACDHAQKDQRRLSGSTYPAHGAQRKLSFCSFVVGSCRPGHLLACSCSSCLRSSLFSSLLVSLGPTSARAAPSLVCIWAE